MCGRKAIQLSWVNVRSQDPGKRFTVALPTDPALVLLRFEHFYELHDVEEFRVSSLRRLDRRVAEEVGSIAIVVISAGRVVEENDIEGSCLQSAKPFRDLLVVGL